MRIFCSLLARQQCGRERIARLLLLGWLAIAASGCVSDRAAGGGSATTPAAPATAPAIAPGDLHTTGAEPDAAAVQQAAARTPRIRVATLNIMAGKRGLDALAQVIAALDVDVIGLQEVDVGTRRSSGRDLLTELAQRLKLHAAFGRAMAFDGGAYGVGLLSRTPLQRVRTVPLPAAAGAEPRALLLAQVEVDGGRWQIGVTHLASLLDGPQASELRRQQARRVAEELGGRPATILLGDLNAPFDETTLSPISIVGVFAGLDAGPTYPAAAPVLRLDHIVYSPDLFQIEAAVVDTRVSDHHALVARIAQKPQ